MNHAWIETTHLRFIIRNDQRILQQQWMQGSNREWRDVPLDLMDKPLQPLNARKPKQE